MMSIAIFQRRNPRPTHACRPPRCPWATREGRARKNMAQEVAQDMAEDVAHDVAQDVAKDLWPWGGRAALAFLAMPQPPPPPSLCSWRYAQMMVLLGSSVAFD